jgi:enoyl-CoA hydratase/carnithine racemase
MAECSFIDYRLQDRGVVVLTLDDPPLNLTTLVTLDKLMSACREIAADERVRVVVVTGSGSKAFCAGSDIGDSRMCGTMSFPASLPARTRPSRHLSNCPCRSSPH